MSSFSPPRIAIESSVELNLLSPTNEENNVGTATAQSVAKMKMNLFENNSDSNRYEKSNVKQKVQKVNNIS